MQRKRYPVFFLILVLSLSLLLPGTGMSAQRSSTKKTKIVTAPAKNASTEAVQANTSGIEPSPGQTNARAAVLMEVSTGTVLFEENANEPIEPASFTKILTLYLLFQALQQGVIHMEDEVWISETAWRTGGSKMFVPVGTKVPLEELLKGVSVVSGNDACVALAEHLAGSVDAFVDAMNLKAKELGMNQSRFLNPHGLPAEGQITTAMDMARLDLSYLQRFPESLRFHSMKEYTYNEITQYNRNRLLLRDPSVDGLKTGYVGAAGYHLAATAERDGMRLLAVVMGAEKPSIRERETAKLLNFGFRYYNLVQPFPKGQPLTTVKVWKGVQDQVSLYPAEAPSFLIPQAQKNLLRWEVKAPPEVTAPVPARQALGDVTFFVSDQPKKTVALINQEELAEAGWFKRTWQWALRIGKVDWRWVTGIGGGIAFLLILIIFISGRKSSRRSRTFGR